jgi:sortase A
VISAHSGEIDALLFTRLHELKKGDFFYLRIMGGVQGYKVNDIRVIQPDDFSYFYTSDPHKAIVTLLTCTPIGINTQRLLVTGVRAKIPMPIPDPDTQSDPVYFWGAIAAGILLIAVIIWFTHRLRAQRRSRYAHSSAHHLSSYAAHSSFDLEGYKPPRRER